jgi:hypothetical protein
MSRRELLDFARLALLRLRVRIARPLPVVLMAALRTLDKWAAERAIDRPALLSRRASWTCTAWPPISLCPRPPCTI